MNATQMKYARSRAEAIYRRRQERIEAKARPTRSMSDLEKIAAIRENRFRVLADDENSQYHSWYNRIEFPEVKAEISKDERDRRAAALRVEYDALLDALVLGEASEAGALIAAFEKGDD